MAKPELIRELQEKLYSRATKDIDPIREHDLSPKNYEVAEDWKYENAPPVSAEKLMQTKSSFSFTAIFLIFSMVFFIGAGIYTFLAVKGGGNTVSADNIDLGISGPISSGGGEKISLDITITNRNRAQLRTVELNIDYPKNTKKAENLGEDLTNERIYIGDIEPGETVRKTISAVLFGEEKSVGDIKFSLEYKIPGSNSIFSKDLIYQIIISSNPISLNVSGPIEAVSGQDISFIINVRSNSAELIKNVLLQTQYPAGFSFKNSSPKAFSGNTFWQLGDLAPGQEKVVTLTGNIIGENEEARVFRFESGVGSSNDRTIPTLFAGFKQEIAIKKPFIGLSIVIAGKKEQEVTLPRNPPVNVEISYINNLATPVNDAVITLNLSGLALDKNGIVAGKGFYQSLNNTVTWNKETLPALSELAPGEGGSVSLTIIPKQGGGIQNPEIIMKGNVSGKRIEESGVPTEIVATVDRRIKFESDMSLSAKSFYYSSQVKNTGAIPPKSEMETTYSITLNITNSSNDVTDTTVTNTLPSYVRYIGEIYPSSEDVSYDEAKRQVTWRAGVVRAGFGQFSKSATFKVGFTPSASQIGSAPNLTGAFTLSGQDRFTNTPINLEQRGVSIKTDDLQFKAGDDAVVP
ncbi:MAG: hypothetical protein AAB513_03005 [Patescibacteria group bacterium]